MVLAWAIRPPQARGINPPAQEHLMPLVNVTLAEGVFTEKQKHDMAARLTDVMVASRDGRPSRSKRG
jgi:tautomerase-like protein